MLKIRGRIQHYAWGGHSYIPQLLGQPQNPEIPCAEYWLGTHPAAPSTVIAAAGSEQETALAEYLASNQLPALKFLFKVLDVRDMLSIQVHPTKAQAEEGFTRENASDIPLTASHRNYKDNSDKPELAVALSDFWLLHGIANDEQITSRLNRAEYLKPLLNAYMKGGTEAAFRLALDTGNPDTQHMHQALAADIVDKQYAKTDILFWVQQWLRQNPQTPNGILTVLFMNLVHLAPGEAIFQPSGLLHAYLEEQNIELMANSDNVLRAGLTPKHIDVAELMKIANFNSTPPPEFIIDTQSTEQGELRYPTPFPDFELSSWNPGQLASPHWLVEQPEILLCLDGTATLTDIVSGSAIVCEKGEAALLWPGHTVSLNGEHFQVFRARNIA